MNLSVVILTKDEEKSIAACVQSVLGVVDDIIVVDSRSTDETLKIAERLGVRVVNFDWNGKYPKKKQWALDNGSLKNDWTLLLDADERCSKELAAALPALTAAPGVVAYDIPLRYFWRGTELRHGQVTYKRSLIRRSHVAFPEIPDLSAPGITEVEGHYQPMARGAVAAISAPLIHDDPDPLSDWFARHNRYSDWEAYLRLNPEVRRLVRGFRTWRGRMLDRLPCRPVAIFLYNWLWRGGWLDGLPGLEYAGSLAFYQWQIAMKVREGRTRARQH